MFLFSVSNEPALQSKKRIEPEFIKSTEKCKLLLPKPS